MVRAHPVPTRRVHIAPFAGDRARATPIGHRPAQTLPFLALPNRCSRLPSPSLPPQMRRPPPLHLSPPLSLPSSPNTLAASSPPAIPRPCCPHGLFRRHTPPWCEAADHDLDEEEEIRAPQRWIDRCEVTTSSFGRGGAARPEIQSAHAGPSCSAPVPKPPPGSLPPSSRIDRTPPPASHPSRWIACGHRGEVLRRRRETPGRERPHGSVPVGEKEGEETGHGDGMSARPQDFALSSSFAGRGPGRATPARHCMGWIYHAGISCKLPC
ncbi:hypothetical protein VPH35_007197 [Triticum aestivum]